MTASAEPGPGTVLGGRYRLEEQVGAGGMATVWRAADLVLERAVAVKLPRRAAGGLRREAAAAAGLAHPHVTAVYDYGEAVRPDGGALPYVVMELLRGESLAARLARGPLPWRHAAGVGAHLAEALAAAHAAGVVHRDVKPANVFLTPGGVKVLDFGIAFTARTSRAGPVWGTPAYAAPELAAGEEPAPSADVYSLGVVLREMLGDTSDDSPDDVPDEAASGVPEEVVAVCRRCLDERPEARPSAGEAAAILGRAAGVPMTTPAEPPPTPAAVPPAAAGAPPHLTKVLLDAPAPAADRRRPLLIGAAAAGGLVLLGGLFALLAPDSPDAERPAPPAVAAPPSAPSPSPSPSSPAASGCAVAYQVTNRWPGGFQVQVQITNQGDEPLTGWRLSWEFTGGRRVAQLWEGGLAQDGSRVTVTAPGYNPSLPPGGTARFGFLGQGDAGEPPQRFTLNGGPCAAS
ncbi:cellulose binding domain-containing protein [Spirillospora sp. NPDC050679]